MPGSCHRVEVRFVLGPSRLREHHVAVSVGELPELEPYWCGNTLGQSLVSAFRENLPDERVDVLVDQLSLGEAARLGAADAGMGLKIQ